MWIVWVSFVKLFGVFKMSELFDVDQTLGVVGEYYVPFPRLSHANPDLSMHCSTSIVFQSYIEKLQIMVSCKTIPIVKKFVL